MENSTKNCNLLWSHALQAMDSDFTNAFVLYKILWVGLNYKKKGKAIPLRPGVAQRLGRGIALLFHDRCTRRGEWSAARPGHPLLPGKTRYPFYRRLGGPQSRSGWAENLVPTGIRSRNVQPVVSRYTYWATRPTDLYGTSIITPLNKVQSRSTQGQIRCELWRKIFIDRII
jgi:hypothetical protein